jgi:hypothetical protein
MKDEDGLQTREPWGQQYDLLRTSGLAPFDGRGRVEAHGRAWSRKPVAIGQLGPRRASAAAWKL